MRTILLKKWMLYLKISFFITLAILFTGIVKIAIMIYTFKWIYHNICPLHTVKTNINTTTMASEINVCQADLMMSLLYDVLLGGYFFTIYGMSSKYLIIFYGKFCHLHFKGLFRKESNDIDNNLQYYIQSERRTISFSKYIVVYLFENNIFIGMTNALIAFMTFGYIRGILDWDEICRSLSSEQTLMEYYVLDESLLLWYEARTLVMDNSYCSNPMLVLIGSLFCLQILLYSGLNVLTFINWSLKPTTKEFEDLIFRLHLHMDGKFRYHQTYIEYLFNNRNFVYRVSI